MSDRDSQDEQDINEMYDISQWPKVPWQPSRLNPGAPLPSREEFDRRVREKLLAESDRQRSYYGPGYVDYAAIFWVPALIGVVMFAVCFLLWVAAVLALGSVYSFFHPNGMA